MRNRIALSILTLLASLHYGYTQKDTLRMDFEDYNPKSTLVVPQHPVTKARYPFIDVHSHQWNLTIDAINRLESEMDQLNMGIMVNLSGRGFDRAAGDIGSQEYLAGKYALTQFQWKDSASTLVIRPGSSTINAFAAVPRAWRIELLPGNESKVIQFDGKPLVLEFE